MQIGHFTRNHKLEIRKTIIIRDVGKKTYYLYYISIRQWFGNWPKTKPNHLMIYVLHSKPLQTTNFLNQSKLDCNIISAKPPFKPRFVNRVVSSMFNPVAGKKIDALVLAFKDTGDTREPLPSTSAKA